MAVELAPRLTDASRRKAWDVHTAFDWPERLDPEAEWYMLPELISIYGTDTYEALSESERQKLSFYEIVNFFSFVLYGERPLIDVLEVLDEKDPRGLDRRPHQHVGETIDGLPTLGQSGATP